ncbi:MAG TPA: hypothetical protein P5243_09140, partial [Bacteroidales bacterium]|nr:hypothetical protein [Bacteroidales bacterium]
MKRAFSPTEVITMKKRVFNFENEFYEAFETPETCGVWFIWGNSGNGKTSFVMQLAKELCKHAKVCYNSLEEGCSLTMRNALSRYEMTDVNKRFQLLDCEPM